MLRSVLDLPAPLGADQADDLAFAHGERDTAHRAQPAVADVQVVNFEHRPISFPDRRASRPD